MKVIKLIHALWHAVWCGMADVTLTWKGKSGEWMNLKEIKCDKCGRVFYNKP